ncbi:MAG: hypothetical protein C0606_16145 [Hyphomicrobiales bacterium]|nr:MAG: hypothetical protein C0606_16145 [Hyphomicrobiales bacterium]
MAQLVVMALIGAGAYFGWKAFKREMARVDKRLRDVEKDKRKAKDSVPTLRAGDDGVFRPSDED